MPGGHAGADGVAAVVSSPHARRPKAASGRRCGPGRRPMVRREEAAEVRMHAGEGARREAACASLDESGRGAAGFAPAVPSRRAGSGGVGRAAVGRASTERCRIGPYRGPAWPRCRQAGAGPAPDLRCWCSPRRSRRSGPRPRSRSVNGSAWAAAGSDGARPAVSGRAPVPAHAGREVRRRCCRAARGTTRTAAAWAGPCGRGHKALARGAGESEVCRGRSSRAPDRRRSCHARRETEWLRTVSEDLEIMAGFGPRLSAKSADNLGFLNPPSSACSIEGRACDPQAGSLMRSPIAVPQSQGVT